MCRKGVGYKAQSTENSEKKDLGRQSRTRKIFFNFFLTMHSEEEEDCSGALYRITSSIAAAKRKGENLSRA